MKTLIVAAFVLASFAGCATTTPATSASTTSTTPVDETVRLREEIARLRRLHDLEVAARAEQGTAQTAPQVSAQAVRPTAPPPPPPVMNIPPMPPLCPGVDPSFGMIPPGMIAVTETMGVSRGGRIQSDAWAHDVWVNMPPAFYVSVEINGRVMSQFAGASGTPTMLVVRHPTTQQLCRMPAIDGPTNTIRFVPESLADDQEMRVRVWYAPTDATGPRVAEHRSMCVKNPVATHSVVGVNSQGRCS